jgi:hypothetical protein
MTSGPQTPFAHARLALLSTSIAAMALSCRDNQDATGARSLLNEVREAEYRSWERAPGYEQRRASRAPHSDAVDIYVNSVVSEMLADRETPHGDMWPIGSIIVKDGFAGGGLELVAIMAKREEGWFWAEYDADGDPFYSGKPDVCLDCHRSGADFVRAFPLPAGP